MWPGVSEYGLGNEIQILAFTVEHAALWHLFDPVYADEPTTLCIAACTSLSPPRINLVMGSRPFLSKGGSYSAVS